MQCNIPEADLAQKLDATVCRYKGEPVYVRYEGGGKLSLWECKDTGNKEAKSTINHTDKEFDISTVPLGYMNGKNGVYYLSRIPLRRTKQGVDGRALRVTSLPTGAKGGGTNRNFYGNDVFFSNGFYDMVMDRYPQLGPSLTRLNQAYEKAPVVNLKETDVIDQIATSKNIALNINAMGNINVYYKNDWVGYIIQGEDVVRVPSNAMGWIISRYLSHELSWKVQ